MNVTARASRISLPIDAVIREVVAAVFGATRETSIAAPSSRTLIIASPGSGKTTRVPWALAQETLGKVYVLEPRRIAAKLSAERVAEENGAVIGAEVGYQFRFEKKRNDSTRVVFLTEGTLLRELQSNQTLKGVDVLILDEFHERHLQADLALALAKRLQETTRPDLKIVIMSATLDATPLENFLPGSKRIEIDALRFPVDLMYRPRDSVGTFGLEKEVRRGIEALLARPDADAFGDFLIFLPGMAEIRRTESELKSAFGSRVEVLPLHGELSKEEQTRALGKSSKRKLILATNIAESSVTIPGVNTVVDAGLARIASHSHASGLPRLETKPISRASAIQRAGRAGRTGPGRVLRLYSKGDFEGRAVHEIPEILRTDLAPVLLDLATLGVFPGFSFFEPPSKERSEAGWRLLRDLGFVDGENSVTAMGKIAGASSFHPRITRSLIEVTRLNIRGDVEERVVAALVALSEGDDVGLDFLEGIRKHRIGGFQSRIRDRLSDTAEKINISLGPARHSSGHAHNLKQSAPLARPATLLSSDEGIARSILAGFHDRVGKRVEKGSARDGDAELLLARGGSVALSKDAFWTQGDLFLVLDLQETKRAGDLRAKTVARSAIAVDEEWLWELEPLPLRENIERTFDEKKKHWVETEVFLLHDLTLSRKTREAALAVGSETERGELSETEWSRIFESWITDFKKGLGERDLEYSPRVAQRTDIEAWTSLEVRYLMLREREAEGSSPGGPFQAESFTELLRDIFYESYRNVHSSRDFPDLSTALSGLWDSDAARKFREEVPSFVALPGRAKVPVHYERGSPVRIESRLQDFFGLRAGPRILGGSLKLSLHLLSPNYRAVQVTEDLEGFWVRHYPAIRKEFMRKYPRHKWPENPLILENGVPGRAPSGNHSNRVKK